MRRISFWVALSIPLINGWDTDGHWIVALIAGEYVRDRTARYLKDTIRLNGQDLPRSLAYHAIWADQQVYDPAYAWTKPLHFAFTDEKCSPFSLVRDCPNGKCIVTGMSDFTRIASTFGADSKNRAEAVKFLIHFMADLHQPLHLGFRKDDGGTTLFLKDPSTTLHNVWDATLMEVYLNKIARGLNYYDVAQVLLRELKAEDIGDYEFSTIDKDSIRNGKTIDVISDIASETTSKVTCPYGYSKMDGSRISQQDTLDESWIKNRQKVMMSQLKKAGIRLAQLLDAVATVYYEEEKANRKKIMKRVEKKVPIKDDNRRKNGFSLLAELGGDMDASTTSEEEDPRE